MSELIVLEGMKVGPQGLERPRSLALESHFGKFYKALDLGFVRVVDYMGNEDGVLRAARVSYGGAKKEKPTSPAGNRKLLRYLIRHRHTSPLEMCEVVLHMKLPIFIARQIVRHRTAGLNEISGRYSTLEEEFYVPDLDRIQAQSRDNKQGSGEPLSDAVQIQIQEAIEHESVGSFAHYRAMNALDLAKELARINLPLNTYTEWYWKMDLHNLLHFLRLRLDPHAQLEARVYAEIVWEMVKDWVPTIAEAYEDFSLRAHTFSGTEMELLRQLVDSFDEEAVGPIVRDLLSDHDIKGRDEKRLRTAIGVKRSSP